MSVSRKIHFNALPESVRRRWVEITAGREQPGPLYVEPRPSGIAGLVLLAFFGLVILAIGCWRHFGLPGAMQSPAWLIGYAGGGFMLVYGTLGLRRQIALRKALPFVPGLYLFGLDLVEVHGEVLELWPMARCRGVHSRDHYLDGEYMYTSLRLLFEGAGKKTLRIRGRDRDEQILQQLGKIQHAVSGAAARLRQGQGSEKELQILLAFDPFFEARMSDQWESLSRKPPSDPRGDAVARPLPRYLAHVAPIALVASVVLGPATWYARNLLSERAAWNDVRSATGSQPVQRYLDLGGRRVAEARALLEQRELEEARGSATALRAFLAKHPGHEDARLAMHALHERALAAFTEQASTADPRLMPFIDALLDHLAKTDRAEVAVSFSRPDAALLDELDKRLGRAAGCNLVEWVAPHFSGATARRRERAIVDRLQQSFGVVFPNGVLSLIHAESSREEARADSRPTIHVAYAIAPSGSLYIDASRNRAFLGMQIDFGVEMRVPGHSETLAFELEVPPASELVVEPSYMAFAELPSSAQPTDLVYRLAIARSFDHLSRKIGSALFRADSEAFERTEGTVQVASASGGTP